MPPTINTAATSLHSEIVSQGDTKDLAAFSCPLPLPARTGEGFDEWLRWLNALQQKVQHEATAASL